MKKIFQNPFGDYKKLLDSFLIRLKKSLWSLGKNAFLFIMIFILLDILLIEFLFYQYVLLPKVQEPEVILVPNKFKEGTYNSVLKEWQIRETIFKNSLLEKLQDPFL